MMVWKDATISGSIEYPMAEATLTIARNSALKLIVLLRPLNALDRFVFISGSNYFVQILNDLASYHDAVYTQRVSTTHPLALSTLRLSQQLFHALSTPITPHLSNVGDYCEIQF